MSSEDAADVFAIPDFWKTSTGLDRGTALGQDGNDFFRLSVNPTNKESTQRESHELRLSSHGFFRLPVTLDSQSEDEPQATPVPENARVSKLTLSSLQLEDPWLIQEADFSHPPEYKSWDQFESEKAAVSPPLFISESSPDVFDALLASDSTISGSLSRHSYDIVKPTAYCSSLLALALGRGSALFAWDDDKKTFVSSLDHFKTPGYSGQVLQNVKALCLDCGNISRGLGAFVDKTYSSHATPSRVAFAKTISNILTTVQRQLGSHGSQTKSLVQLQALVRPVWTLSQYIKSLVIKLSKSKSDEELLSTLFIEVQAVENREVFLRDTVRDILKAVSKPWTDFVEEWTGLAPETGIRINKNGHGKGFVKVENRMWIDDMGFELEEPDYFLDTGKMPSFMPDEVAQSLFKTGRNLRLLQSNKPDHPLSNLMAAAAAHPPTLQWHFDWDSIAAIERKAVAYEQSLTQAIQLANSTKPSIESTHTKMPGEQPVRELQIFGHGENEIERRLLASIAELDQPLSIPAEDGLTATLRPIRYESEIESNQRSNIMDLTPPWSLLPLLSFSPIISAQARVVNRECVKLLFNPFQLREHLSMQRDFHLLGNGVFSSRLAHALFDPNQGTAERQAGVALSGGMMGLRLSGRENWPPASSELRLALMGILSESYQPSGSKHASTHGTKQELPGDLSFAVRDLSPEEIEKCMEPQSLEALDFLRLSYKAPAPLLPIFTPIILTKYDHIFRLLLRILRMSYVLHELFRRASEYALLRGYDVDPVFVKFRIEAHHFISTIMAYFFDTGIALPWLRFETWLDTVEEETAGFETTSGEAYSPDRIHDLHEQVLDEIMLTLFLRKRQRPVQRVLEDIFRIILQFSKISRVYVDSKVGEDAVEQMQVLYLSFRKEVEAFITICKSLGEKRSGGSRQERGSRLKDGGLPGGSENAIERLLLMLDMTDHYAKKPLN